MKTVSAACPPDEKRAALEAVLASRSFDRSDQLKRFLRYVCERELAGKADELTEYLIGVEALGRPESFSPNEDSIVRNRAYAVRRKLEEYYRDEAPDAPLRIELPKGAYTPRFLRPADVEEPRLATAPSREAVRRIVVPLLALAVGGAMGVLGCWLALRERIRPQPSPVVRAAWAEMLDSRQTVLVSVATPAQTFIREFPEANPPVPGLHPVEDSVVQWYRRHRPLAQGIVLLGVPTFNSPLWGDAAGAFRVASLLRQYGAEPELLAERLVTPPVFRGRNVVFFGSGEYSEAVSRLMRGLPLRTGYDPVAHDYIAYEVDAAGKVIARFPPKREPAQGSLVEVFGLVTALPSEGDGGQRSRSVVFSGISSAGTQAAAEFFTTPSHLEALARHFGVRPGEPWPQRFQVLVHATTDRTVALGVAYRTHRIVK
jgi:hypothetical protein